MLSHEQFKDYVFHGGELPETCIKDLINSASKTIERAIYKANKQIEETKKTFKIPNAEGIVFLINDGNYFFSNLGFWTIIANLIGRKFKGASFDVVIYLTINQPSRKKDSELDHHFWIPIYIQK